MSRNDSLLNGTPMWVKAVSVVGIPGAIALYLVYYVATTSAGDHKQLMQQHERSNAFLGQICRNTARSASQETICSQIELGVGQGQ